MKSKRVGRDGPHAQKLPALRRLPVFVVRPGRMKFYGRFALAPGERTAGEGAAAGLDWSVLDHLEEEDEHECHCGHDHDHGEGCCHHHHEG